LYDKFEKEVDMIQSGDSKTILKIPGGKSLKEAEISKTLLECDVLINIPIVKHIKAQILLPT